MIAALKPHACHIQYRPKNRMHFAAASEFTCRKRHTVRHVYADRAMHRHSMLIYDRSGIRIDQRVHFQREKMTRLLNAGFVDTFRALHPDETGAYSWWSYRFHARENNAGWRIDYFIVSESLREHVREAAIHPEIFGSDHCPVELVLDI